MGCNCSQGRKAGVLVRPHIAAATRAASAAARAASAAKAQGGCPPGGCHGKRGVIVEPKAKQVGRKPTPAKRPCKC